MLEALHDMLRAEAFRPFRIVTTSGHQYEVADPHLVAVGQSLLHYCYPRSDRLAQIRLNQIVTLETVEKAA